MSRFVFSMLWICVTLVSFMKLKCCWQIWNGNLISSNLIFWYRNFIGVEGGGRLYEVSQGYLFE